ncbi:Gfo/Idh/MocA family protein [Nocardia takedensis]|uniref:Gfo/Idh/MocA family protein n=1 Tax=Nocardia takedensis TaxID=259390 RepID=UPI0002EA2DF3|nr:Gfo/Idh/MocA family oxidoreductase [Nocardia takedensis]
MAPVTIGVAGAGRIGSAHAAALARLSEVERVLVADVDADRAAKLAADLGVEAVADVTALLASDLTGLVVATPTDTHPELVTRAVDEGVPVLCEKPLAADLAGTLSLLTRLEQREVPVQVGFQRRFDAGYRAARAAVADGRLGRVHSLRATTLDPAPPPADYLPHSGGIFRDCGVHDFDALRWVSGREVVEVYARGANRGDAIFAACDDVDTAHVVLALDDDSLATVALTRYNGAGYDVRLEVLGSHGNVVVGLDGRTPLHSAEPGVPGPDRPHANFLDRFADAYAEELACFVRAATGQGPVLCPPRDALEAFYIAEACALSRRAGRPVAVAEVRVAD